MSSDKSLPITKAMVWKAYQLVKRNGKAAGVDGQSLDDFAQDLENNLYKLWNRMASGSYFPPAVRRVEIPKSGGGSRPLGIPTVADRVAQMVVKQVLEPQLEPIFDQDSYGYRPGKSAHQAVESCRKRCWKYDWVVDLDIKGFFDSIDHDLPDAGPPVSYLRALGAAVSAALVGGTGGIAGWVSPGTDQWHAPGWCHQSVACQSVSALCV